MRVCALCGHALDDALEVFRTTSCPSCDRDLKICLNCRFYRPGVHWDCLETIPEPAAEKDRANFCDYFRFNPRAPQGSAADKRNGARDGFRKLFGNGA